MLNIRLVPWGMLLAILLLLALYVVADAPAPPEYEKVEVLGNQTSTNAKVGRDLGFSGRIGNTVLYTYGDSHRCGYSEPKTNSSSAIDQFGCILPSASDGVAKGTDDPLKVTDYDRYLGGSDHVWPRQFCPYNDDEPHNNGQWAIGITTIIPVSENEGMLFFLINNRTEKPILVGAGVASVTFDLSGTPVCERLRDNSKTGRAASYWWSTDEPNYGAYAAFLGNDGYIYAMGNSDSNSYVFLTRVLQRQYNNLTAYTYWNGSAYNPDRPKSSDARASAFPGIGQSSVVWSPFFDGYVMFTSKLGAIQARVAHRPEGPWSKPTKLHDGECADVGCSYTPVGQPWWDDTGKSVVVTYTVAGGYDLRVLNVTWKGEPVAGPDSSPYSPHFVVDPQNAIPSTTTYPAPDVSRGAASRPEQSVDWLMMITSITVLAVTIIAFGALI